MRVGIRTRRWLVSAHLVVAGAWLGGAVGLVLILWLRATAAPADGIHGVMAAARLVDDFVIIPAALGSLLTGLLLSLLTPWGFFKHGWVTVKWVATVTAILFGTFFLGPWLNAMNTLAAFQRAAVLTDPTFLHNRAANLAGGLFQVAGLLAMVVVSVFKPWSRKAKADLTPLA